MGGVTGPVIQENLTACLVIALAVVQLFIFFIARALLGKATKKNSVNTGELGRGYNESS